MSLLRQHVVLMVLYAAGTAAFFALLRRREPQPRLRLFLLIFASLLFGGIALAWLMYPFPR